VWAVLTAGTGETVVAVVGLIGATVLAVAFLGRWQDLLPWGIALLGGQYAAALLLRDEEIDAGAPLYAAGLFVTAELAYWALERGPTARAVVASRLTGLLAAALGAAAVGAIVLSAAEGGGGEGAAVQALGLGAAAAAVGLVTWLAWRSRSD
jgi:hypothetical protein